MSKKDETTKVVIKTKRHQKYSQIVTSALGAMRAAAELQKSKSNPRDEKIMRLATELLTLGEQGFMQEVFLYTDNKEEN